MSKNVLTVEEAARCLPALVERIRASGESALLVGAGRPLARIVRAVEAEESADDLVAFLHRWRTDHPLPDEQFAEAIAESRRSIQPPRDPWE